MSVNIYETNKSCSGFLQGRIAVVQSHCESWTDHNKGGKNAYLYLLNEITAYKSIKAALLFLISPTLSTISLASKMVLFCTLSD